MEGSCSLPLCLCEQWCLLNLSPGVTRTKSKVYTLCVQDKNNLRIIVSVKFLHMYWINFISICGKCFKCEVTVKMATL